MSFDISFDYRFDTAGFYTQEVRAALEAAAGIWEEIILDEFPDFKAGQPIVISNPETNERETFALENDIDDLLIFMGARPLEGALALAGPSGGSFLAGDANFLRIASNFRDQGPTTDFEPYVGVIQFDPDYNWGFNIDAPEAGKQDFISTALHEIGHVLGIVSSGVFESQVEDRVFIGVNAKAVTGGTGIQLEPTFAHIARDLPGGPSVMDTYNRQGERQLPSNLDKAILADIGYEIAGFVTQGRKFELATEEGETIFGSVLADTINALAGDDIISSSAGENHLRGGAGSDTIFGGADMERFYFSPGDGRSEIVDFDFINEKIVIDPAFGFTTAQEVLALVSNPFSNISQINLPGGASAYLYHNGSGSSLTAQNIEFGTFPGIDPTPGTSTPAQSTPGSDIISGTAGDDVILGSAGNDRIDSGAGTDTVSYSGDQDSYTLTISRDGISLTDRRADGNGTDTLIDLEFLSFDTGINSGPFDLSLFGGSAGLSAAAMESVIELYIAYFNRAPDAVGLNYWGTEFSKGFTLAEMANSFFVQPETRAAYSASLDDAGNLANVGAFVSAVYDNVLGRAPDQEGFDYWVNEVQNNPEITPGIFILALLNGAKNPSNPTVLTALDQQYLANKTDIGAYFAVSLGLSDTDAARDVMMQYDGTQASVISAVNASDAYHATALDAEDGAFLMPLLGVIETPFTDLAG